MKFLIYSLLTSICVAQQVEIKTERVTVYASAQVGTNMPALTHKICNTSDSQSVLEALKTMKPAQSVNQIQADKHPTWNWLRLMFGHSE